MKNLREGPKNQADPNPVSTQCQNAYLIGHNLVVPEKGEHNYGRKKGVKNWKNSEWSVRILHWIMNIFSIHYFFAEAKSKRDG